MKKLLILVGLVALFISGCEEEKTLTCTKVDEEHVNWRDTIDIEISYSGEYITKKVETRKKTFKDGGELTSIDLSNLYAYVISYREGVGSFFKRTLGDKYELTTEVKGNSSIIFETFDYSDEKYYKIADERRNYIEKGFTCK